MIFEVGKYYRNRGNYKCRVLATDASGTRPLIVLRIDDGYPVSLCGNGVAVPSKENNLDLIAEWKNEPVVEWQAMPAWAHFVAQTKRGEWYYFTHRPVLTSGAWNIGMAGDAVIIGDIHPNFYPVFTDDWKDSLVQRPGKEAS